MTTALQLIKEFEEKTISNRKPLLATWQAIERSQDEYKQLMSMTHWNVYEEKDAANFKEKFPQLNLGKEQSLYLVSRYKFKLVEELINPIEDLSLKLQFLIQIKAEFEYDWETLEAANTTHNYRHVISEVRNFGRLCQIEMDKIKQLQEIEKRKTELEILQIPEREFQRKLLEESVKAPLERQFGIEPLGQNQSSSLLDDSKKSNSDTKDKGRDRRSFGGSQYQNLLAMHYLFEYLQTKNNKSAKARFASFLTGFSPNTFYNDSFNIHAKQDEDGVNWEKDMMAVKKFFDELGLDDIVRMIDNDLYS